MVEEQPADEAGRAGRRYYWRSGFVPELDDGTIDVLSPGVRSRAPAEDPRADRPHARHRDPAGADRDGIPHRSVGFKLIVSSGWEDPDHDDRNISWTDDVWRPLSPHSTGVYVNTLGSDGHRYIREAYGPSHDRQARIKAQYDPENFFRMNQNIEPAG